MVLVQDGLVGPALEQDLAPLGHSVAVVPSVETAQVALQAEQFDAVVLSARLLDEAAYSLVDYIRITRPHLRVLLIHDSSQCPDRSGSVDWLLNPPASALEIVQVLEHLRDQGVARQADRKDSFTYAGSKVAGSGRRSWLN